MELRLQIIIHEAEIDNGIFAKKNMNKVEGIICKCGNPALWKVKETGEYICDECKLKYEKGTEIIWIQSIEK